MPVVRHDDTSHLDGSAQECVADCLDCFEAVTECIAFCLKQVGGHDCLKHLRSLMDCAAISQLNADFLLRDSDMSQRISGICAAACKHCARDCEAIDSADGRWRRCGEACHRCAASCEDMATRYGTSVEGLSGRDELTN